VVKAGKVVGFVTTNDFFYNIINPLLGIGKPRTRIFIPGGGDGKAAQKIISIINNLGVTIEVLWIISAAKSNKNDSSSSLKLTMPQKSSQSCRTQASLPLSDPANRFISAASVAQW